jgi:hypothetical protein
MPHTDLVDCIQFALLGSLLFTNRDEIYEEPRAEKHKQIFAVRATIMGAYDLLARILSKADWDYVSGHPAEKTRNMFLRDRQELKRLWILRLKKAIGDRFRAGKSGLPANSGLAIKLRLSYGLFRMNCSALLFLIQIGCPLRSAAPLRILAGIARRLESMIGKIGRSAALSEREEREKPARDRVRNLDVAEAIERIRSRELSGLRSEFSALAYLSSTRDYNSGRYFHDGLVRRYGEEVMEKAMTVSHEEVFERLINAPLSELVRQMELYVRAIPETPAIVLGAWRKLEPFRVLIPMNSDPISVKIFISNVRVALAALQSYGQNDE